MFQLIIIYLIIAFFASWWPFSPDKWEGFVYPDKHDLTIHKNIGVYESLESCRSAAIYKLRIVSELKQGDYECGLNCERRDGYGGIKICEETSR